MWAQGCSELNLLKMNFLGLWSRKKGLSGYSIAQGDHCGFKISHVHNHLEELSGFENYLDRDACVQARFSAMCEFRCTGAAAVWVLARISEA